MEEHTIVSMRSAPRHAAVGVALIALLGLGVGGQSARAEHGSDAFGAVEQSGDGSGNSTPLIRDFGLATVLYDAGRFAVPNPRPTYPRYLAWGTVTQTINNQPETVVAMVRGGDTGLAWDVPSPATLRDPAGNDVPFLINAARDAFDVVFTNRREAPFQIVYITPTPPGGTVEATTIDRFHIADSLDGIHWVNDRPLTLAAGAPAVVSAARPSYGPADVVFQVFPTLTPAGTQSTVRNDTAARTDCATADPDATGPLGPSPWNCRYVMVHDAVSGADEFLALASSPDGVSWTGRGSALLGVGAPGSWDDDTATQGHLRLIPRPGNDGRLGTTDDVTAYEMYYAGGRAPDSACAGGAQGCWSLGTARSTDGLAFTRVEAVPGRPASPSSLLDAFAADAPVTIRNPQPVVNGDPGGHVRIYFQRYDNARRKDLFVASSAPAAPCGAVAPAPCTYPPVIRVVSPRAAVRDGRLGIVAYVADARGTLTGIDARTLQMTLDAGTPQARAIDSYTLERTLVTARTTPAYRVTSPPDTRALAEGEHTLTIRVADLDGNVATLTSTFVVDTGAPATEMTGRPASPQIGFPDSIGTFSGRTVDAGTGLDRLRVTITDPLGARKTWSSSEKDRWIITKDGARDWSWTWVAPSLEPHFLIPGDYRVSVTGRDLTGAEEASTSANTAIVTVI